MICWVDLETTGLEDHDQVLEIAAVLTTDDTLEPVGSYYRLRPLPFPLVLPDVVREMHTKSGLLDACASAPQANMTNAEVDLELQRFLQRNGVAQHSAPLGGASVHFDRRMMHSYFPTFESLLHYRNFDVRSIKIGVQTWAPALMPPHPSEPVHRAMPDVLHTISEAKYLRDNLFFPALKVWEHEQHYGNE